MYSICSIIWIFLLSSMIRVSNEIEILYLGALFDHDHHNPNDFRAAQLAVEEINQRSNELFHGAYRLELLANNSRVD